MKKRNDRLCYLDASKVESPVGQLAHIDLRSRANHLLGNLEGVVIDAAERKLLYFVVESASGDGRRHVLLPADAAWVEAGQRSLRLEVEPDDLCGFEEFDRGSIRELGVEFGAAL